MANGLYGQTIPANITSRDVEIWYTYSENHNTVSSESGIWKQLDSNILRQQTRDVSNGAPDEFLEGMYKINLPASVFNKPGFYSVYIKPREIRATIVDVSALRDFPDVRGIVVNAEAVDGEFRSLFNTNDGLVGYRVCYLDTSTGTRQDYVRLVTSNTKCEPVIKQARNSSDRSRMYVYNSSSTLTFITLTPSMTTSYSAANIVPYIGVKDQEVLFINTKFTPIHFDIHIVENDADTLTTLIKGDQVLNMENGLTTIFTDNGEPFTQYRTVTIKDEYTGQPVKRQRVNMGDNIDTRETIDK